MSWVDIIIALIVIIATDRGFAMGVLRQVGTLVGFVSGFVLGVLIAPKLALHVQGNPVRPLVAALIVGACTLLGSFLGRKLGEAANLAFRRLHLGRIDRLLGAIFAAAGSLVACWLVAGLLVNVPMGSLSSAMATSRLLAVMDTVMPPVPSVEAKVQALFHTSGFPTVFADVVPPRNPTFRVPDTAVTLAALGDDRASVLKVTSINACGQDREGTGFVIAPGLVATAAHVVAGSHYVVVDSHAARLVALDPDNDVAILQLASTPRVLALVTRPLAPATPGAVAGYPNNGGLVISPAALAGSISAQGRDIYNNALITRPLLVVDTNVAPGNSGSPFIVGGDVAGLIFSKSVALSNVAYAVPASVLRVDLARAHRGVAVSSGACLVD